MLRTRGTLSLSFLLAGVQGTLLPALEVGLEEGKLFPDLVLPALNDGRPTSVSGFRGRKLLLLVFASW